jgi:uncharacterized protein HemX
MKNPFKKEDNTALWITTAITGALAAGAGVWFYLRGKRAAEREAYRLEHAQDYLKVDHPKKKHKTDVHELANIIHHPQL